MQKTFETVSWGPGGAEHDKKVNNARKELQEEWDIMIEPTTITVNVVSRDDFQSMRGHEMNNPRDLLMYTYHTVIQCYPPLPLEEEDNQG